MQKTVYSLAQIAKEFQVEFFGNPEHLIYGVSDLESANQHQASFFANPRYEQAMKKSQAGVIVLSKEALKCFSEEELRVRNFLISQEPSRTFQALLELFSEHETKCTAFDGIHPTAVIHESAEVHPSATIGPNVVIDGQVKIGSGTSIGSGAYIGLKTQVGQDCVIYPNVTIREHCTIGNRVVIQPGAVIGSCGFGFTTDKSGKHTKLNQVGRVVIGDDVEIGANTTIDRARFQATSVGEGTKIDNLVQIAHGVVIGKHSLIIAQTGIAGSTEIGNHVVLAGQVAVNGHIQITNQVMVAARSAVSKSLTKPGKYGGVPVMPLADYNRMAVHLQNIEKLVKEVKALRKELDVLTSK